MDDLSTEAIARVGEARRQAEIELKKALSAIRYSESVEPYVPQFAAFAAALYDAEARELLISCKTYSDFQAELKDLALRIVEDILPDRGLAEAWANMPDELRNVSIEWDMATGRRSEIQRTKPMSFDGEWDRAPQKGGVVWETIPVSTPARPEAFTLERPYGYWDLIAPEHMRYRLRLSPREKAILRDALFWAIHDREGFWLDRFHSRTSAESSRVAPENANCEMASSTEVSPPATQPKPRKRGPRPNFDTAARVAEIVAGVAPDEDWRPRLEAICEALDDKQIPVPHGWRRKRNYRLWTVCLERDLAIKAIEYRLRIAKQYAKRTPETFS